MTKHVTRYHVLAALAAVLVVAAAGSLIGSNMGFKIVNDYDTVVDSASMYGLALPHHNPWRNSPGGDSTNFLQDMFDGTNEIGLRYWDNAANAFQEHSIYHYDSTGGGFTTFGGVPFEFNEGEGYFWRAGGSTKSATIVGSHDPTFPKAPIDYENLPGSASLYGIALAPNLKAKADGGWSTSGDLLQAWFNGTNGFGLRYWDNATNAFQEHSIYHYDSTGGGFTTFGGVPFNLEAGKAVGYMVRVDGPPGSKVQRTQEPYY